MKIGELHEFGQEYLLAHYQSLTAEEKSLFEQDIAKVDYPKIEQLYRQLVLGSNQQEDFSDVKPLSAKTNLTAEELKSLGENALKAGKVAVLLLAGGQGTRLGHKGPKGTFDLGVEDANSLFEIQANSLKQLAQKYGQYLPWYIMTSKINHQATLDFFAEHNSFAYPQDKLHFFSQNMIESVDNQGKLMLANKTELVRSPDGNGGVFAALKQNNIVDQMLAEGYQWLFIYNVDNAITSIADPAFVGAAIDAGNPCAIKVVPKLTADEKVGVPCLCNGKPAILEYTEIGEDRARKVDSEGQLVFDGANIGNYLLDLKALQELLNQPLEYHLAHKKINHYQDGEIKIADIANGYKFELFIFDIFKEMSGMTVYQGNRENDFAPVKNKTGNDSPETARILYEKKKQSHQ